MFRVHAFFEEGVKRLEFEVEWKEGQPSVGAVAPNGASHQRGIIPGDRVIEIAGSQTTGRGREQLLPLLQQRPLQLKIDREDRVLDPQEPHIELEVKFRGTSSDHGLEVIWRGQMPVASIVRPQSAAWIAGILEGDGLSRVDGRDVTKEPKAALLAALAKGPKVVTVWRRPLGMDLTAPWHLKA